MRKKTTIVFILFLSILFATKAQTIILDENTCDKVITLTSNDGRQVDVGMTMSYDTKRGSIMMDITPKSDIYNRMWIPSGKMKKSEIRSYTYNKLYGKTRFRRSFRHTVSRGVSGAFECRNAIVLEKPECDILRTGETSHYEFQVVKQDKPVMIRIICAAPVSEEETAFGRRFVYYFVATSKEMNIILRGNPCLKKENAEMLESLSKLVEDADLHYDKMVQSRNRKNFKECDAEKKYFVAQVKPHYDSWRQNNNAVGSDCTEIQEEMDTWVNIMQSAQNVKCEGGVVATPSDYKKVIKDLRSNTSDLNNCLNNIRSNKDVAGNKRRGEELIKKTESIISNARTNHFTPGEKKEFQSACNAFNSMKETFRINAGRK